MTNRKGTRRGNREGSIVKRKDGRYQVQVIIGYGEHGKPRYRYAYARRRDDATEELHRLLRETGDGLPAPRQRLTVALYLTEWIQGLRTGSIRPGTWASYELHVRIYLIPQIGHIRLTELQPTDVRRLLDHLLTVRSTKTNRQLSPRSVQMAHATLRRALGDAVENGYIARNVAKLARGVNVERHEVQPLTVEQAAALLQAIQTDRLGGLYRLILSLGLRRGEGLGLRWEDVDWQGKTLRIQQAVRRSPKQLRQAGDPSRVLAPPKTERSRRTLSLPDSLVAMLDYQHKQQAAERLKAGTAWVERDLIFPNAIGEPHDPDYISRHFVALVERAGLPRKRLHDLRHSLASFLKRSGADMRTIMEIMGHTQMSTTSDLYTHVMPEVSAEELAKVQELIG